MKIIDIHAHTGQWAMHTKITDEHITDIMDEFNIEKAVFSSGKALMYDMETGNRENYDFVMKDPRCYGYIVINQNKIEDSKNELKKYLGKKRIVGIKMHPEQFHHPVNSRESEILLSVINSYGMPVLIHTAHFEESRPNNVLDIALKYPNNKYILAHMGNAWWKEAVDTAQKTKNIYVDIVSSWRGYDQIKYACDRLGIHKVLFGSDFTLLDPAIAIGTVKSSELSDNDKSLIFRENALSLFNFD